MTPEIQNAFAAKADKYCDLVWYARSGCRLNQHDSDLRAKVLKERERIQRLYPKEANFHELLKKGHNMTWDRGFHSGCLAAFRYVLTALNEGTEIDEFGEEFVIGGLAEAEAEFPMLDT